MADVLLYHMPPSFYSQVARLVLEEKGVRWNGQIIWAGPPFCESYEPWYMTLNPGGTVPTLVHGDQTLPDSRLIIEYVDRELSYGKAGRQGRIANKGRLRNLQARRERFPELRSIYDAKIADIEEFSANSMSQEKVATHERIVEERLDELEALLGQQPWIAGETYSLADAVWTVGLGRLVFFELEPTTGRPALKKYFDRLKERPSYASADIWDRAKGGALARMFLTKVGERFRRRRRSAR
jgi:glutathione S-transferase